MTKVNKKFGSTNFAERLAELSADYLQEIINGNFELSIDKKTASNICFTIEVGGLKQSSSFYIKNKCFFTFGITDPVSLFPEFTPAPDALIAAIEKKEAEYRDARMRELMTEYSELAKQNGEL